MSSLATSDSFLVRINVSGSVYELPRHRLATYSSTRLGLIATLPAVEAATMCDHYSAQNQEFYFERSPTVFAYVLSYYRTGEVHLPDVNNVCHVELLREFHYWGIHHEHMAGCCTDKVPTPRISKARQFMLKNMENHEHHCCVKLRDTLWKWTNTPEASIPGYVYIAINFLMISLSTVLIIICSYPYFQQPSPLTFDPEGANLTDAQKLEVTTYHVLIDRHLIIKALNYITTAWFTIDFLIRLFAAPCWWKFMFSFWSFLDILTFLPFYCFVIAINAHGVQDPEVARQVMFALRILRILQFIKFMKFSKGSELVINTLYTSVVELGFLFLIIFVLVLVFSTFMYLLEYKVPDSQFPNIPTAMYWCFITVTTVGYGDIVPKSVAGRILCAFVTFIGILVLAMPFSVIVSKFAKMYDAKEVERKLDAAEAIFEEFSRNNKRDSMAIMKARMTSTFIDVKGEQPMKKRFSMVDKVFPQAVNNSKPQFTETESGI